MEIFFKNSLNAILPLNDIEWQAFLSICIHQTMKPKEHISRSAYIGRRSFFLAKGAFRMYYINDEGTELTTHFFFEPNFITNCEIFLSKIQDNLQIQATEECELLVFSNDALTNLYEIYPNLKAIEAFVIKSVLNETVQHNFLLQEKKPEEKYKLFFSKNPSLINRVSVTHLSSYLGIARETLSRVRASCIL